MRSFLTRVLLIIIFPAILYGKQIQTTKTRILVYPFQNLGSVKYNWLSDGMTDSVLSDLKRLPEISVIGDVERRKIMKELELKLDGRFDTTAARVGKLSGADLIFTGNYVIAGGRIRVYSKMIHVETGVIERAGRIDGTLDDIFNIQESIVFSLMTKSGEMNLAGGDMGGLPGSLRKRLKKKIRPHINAYSLYSRGLAKKDNPTEALDYFKKALKVSPDYLDALREAGFTAGVKLNHFSEAFNYLSLARKLARKLDKEDYKDYADVLVKTGLVYNTKGEQDRASAYYKKALKLYEKNKNIDADEYAVLLINMGVSYSMHGYVNKALKYYLKSRMIREKQELRYTREYATLLGNIGTIYSKKENMGKALKYHEQAKKIRDYLKLQNTMEYAILLNNIGSVHTKMGMYKKAVKYRIHSKRIRDKLGLSMTSGYAILLSNLGVDYTKMTDHKNALKYFRMAEKIYRRLDMTKSFSYAVLLNNIGYVYAGMGKKQEAVMYYDRTGKLFKELDSLETVNHGVLLYNYALLHEEQGEKELAVKELKHAYEIFKKEGYVGYRKMDAEKRIKKLIASEN